MRVTKHCPRCKSDQPIRMFSRAASRPDGLQLWCKPCFSEQKRAKYKADPAKHCARTQRHYRSMTEEQRRVWNRRNNLRGKYGLTPEAFDELVERQGGRCAICRTAEPGGRHGQWHIDHDHTCCPGQRSCGKCIRSLLCSRCNTGIGQFSDDPERLMAAAAYLLGFKDVLRVPA